MTPEALAALHAVCFTHPRPWSAAEFAALLAGPGVVLLTEAPAPPPHPSPTQGGGSRLPVPAGFLLGRVAAGEAEVLTLAVDPARRRQGLGRALLARFLGVAASRAAGRVFLEAAADNAAARMLYATAGFAEVGRRRGYAGPGLDALVFARDLGRDPGRESG